MPLNPDIARYFEILAREVPPFAGSTPTVHERRERMEWIARRFGAERPAGVEVRDLRLPLTGRTLTARLYRPAGSRGKTLPLLVYYHGGGWVIGSVQTHDGLTANLAQDAGVAVLSVEYRMSPEFPFPVPCDDAYDAFVWAHANAADLGVDKRRIAVGGDSAGAHLATGVAIAARDRDAAEIAFQLLLYPTVEPVFDTESMTTYANGPGLTRADMEFFWNAFLPGGPSYEDPRAIPSEAESLAGLPPAYIVLAQFDPLRDEGALYALLLDEAGVNVKQVEAEGLTHGFARQQGIVPAAREQMVWAAAAVREALLR